MTQLIAWYISALAISAALVPLCRAFARKHGLRRAAQSGSVAREADSAPWRCRDSRHDAAVRAGYRARPPPASGHHRRRTDVSRRVCGRCDLVETFDEAHCGNRDGLVSPGIFSGPVTLDGFGISRHAAHDGVAHRRDQCVQPAGQYGRLCAGIAPHCRVLASGRLVCLHRRWRRNPVSGGPPGATSGFLIYNFFPASIFMGDAGSLFLGFSIATLTLTTGGPAHDRSNVLSVIAVPFLILLIPILDTTLVTISRILGGRSVSQGGRDHSSHRLVAIGLSERAAVGVLWTLAAAGGTVRVLRSRSSATTGRGSSRACSILSIVIFSVYLAQVRVYADAADAPRPWDHSGCRRLHVQEASGEVVLDMCLVTTAYYVAWRLRFDTPLEWSQYVRPIPRIVCLSSWALRW